MSGIKFRLIKVKNANVDDWEGKAIYQNNNPNLYVLKKKKLFGGWKRIYSSSYKSHAVEEFYKISNGKRDEDEVMLEF